jgi:hypothetical protein
MTAERRKKPAHKVTNAEIIQDNPKQWRVIANHSRPEE